MDNECPQGSRRPPMPPPPNKMHPPPPGGGPPRWRWSRGRWRWNAHRWIWARGDGDGDGGSKCPAALCAQSRLPRSRLTSGYCAGFTGCSPSSPDRGATRPPAYDARYSVILVPIFDRRCSPLPSLVFLLFAAFYRSALRCSSDSGDGLSGLREAVNSETLNISGCGKRPARLHSLTRCWLATRLSIVCRS